MKKRKQDNREAMVEIRFLEGVSRRLVDHADTLKALGDLYTGTGLVEKGLETDLKLTALCPQDPMIWYNLGCSYALTAQPDRAFDALTRAAELGYADVKWMRQDEDLVTLRDDARFERLLLRLGESLRESDAP